MRVKGDHLINIIEVPGTCHLRQDFEQLMQYRVWDIESLEIFSYRLGEIVGRLKGLREQVKSDMLEIG